MSQEEVSYDVYVLQGYDAAGEEVWGEEAVAHFSEERNALAYRDRLEAAGETVHVQRATIQNFSELAKEKWFSDYHPD